MLTLLGATWVASAQSDPMPIAATAAPTAEVAVVDDPPPRPATFVCPIRVVCIRDIKAYRCA